MKNIVKSTLLVLSIVFSGAFNTLSAQENTETEEKDNKKSYKTGDTFLERISLTGQVGWLHSWGDFKKDGFMPSFL